MNTSSYIKSNHNSTENRLRIDRHREDTLGAEKKKSNISNGVYSKVVDFSTYHMNANRDGISVRSEKARSVNTESQNRLGGNSLRSRELMKNKEKIGHIITERDRVDTLRVWIFGALLVVLLILLSIVAGTRSVTAQRERDRVKLVQSIQIKKGDTLWSIAKEFMSEEYDTIHDYVEELMNSNGLDSDKIHAGNYIIVPYYTDMTNDYAMMND